MCLFWEADLWLPPCRQISSVQDPRKAWLAAGSLLAVWWRMLSLGLILPLAFRLCCLPPASLPPVLGGASLQPASSPLLFAQSFVL